MAVTQLELQASDRASTAGGAPRPAAALYVLWALFWVLMIVIALHDYFRAGGRRWWEPLLWEGSSALAATFWFTLQRLADRRYSVHLDRPLRWFGHHFKWLPLLALSFIASIYAIRHGVYALLGHTYTHDSWALVFVYETIKLALFVSLWLGAIFAFDSFSRWQAQREHLLRMQKSLAEVRLSQLKAQLRPHFFFNALNTISALMHVDVARADRLLARLADLLRSSLQSGEQETVPLREEVRLLELYAQIMQERFAERAHLHWAIGEETLNTVVPALLLQPLMENAFKHGVERSRGPVRIEIESRREGDRLNLAIRNTGPPLEPGCREGVGLRNCRERLHVMYREEANLQLVQNAETVEARVTLPWSKRCP